MNTRLLTLLLSFLLALCLIVTAVAGLFWPATYALEKPQGVIGGTATDTMNLLLNVPVLLITALLAYRGSLSARLVWMGTLLCILYNGVIYAFFVHFNNMFLFYCGVLGAGFYALLAGLRSLSPDDVAARYAPTAPIKTTAIVFFAIVLLFGAQWLKEIIPALLAGHPPQSVTEGDQVTNPIFVLDLSLLFPGMVITAVMLLRRKLLAFIFAPALMAFAVLMVADIAGLMLALARNGYGPSYTMAAFFFASAAACALLLFRFLHPKKLSIETRTAVRISV